MGIVDVVGIGKWELTYFQKVIGKSYNSRQVGSIEPIELPYLTEVSNFLVGASCFKSKPNWRRAGFLFRQLENVSIDDTVIFEGERLPFISVDAENKLIDLNKVQLATFSKSPSSFRLRFEPFKWIPEITLAIWEYRGNESDVDNVDNQSIEAIRAKLETIEYKIDQLWI
jgi:hypothetical protein